MTVVGYLLVGVLGLGLMFWWEMSGNNDGWKGCLYYDSIDVYRMSWMLRDVNGNKYMEVHNELELHEIEVIYGNNSDQVLWMEVVKLTGKDGCDHLNCKIHREGVEWE